MAIYRPPKARWPLAASAAVVGTVIGLLIGSLWLGTNSDQVGVLEDLDTSLSDAAATLEIVAIEYDEAVEGEEIVNRAEYDGAVDALARSRAQFEETNEAVTIVDPAGAASIGDSYEEIGAMVEETAPPEDVTAATEELATLLNDLLGD